MRTTLFALALLLSHAAAATTFVIGNEPFELEFEANPTNEVFRTFVAEDVSRVFAPLGNISNVVDIAALQQHPELSRGLTFHEWCPDGFSGGWSVTNRNGMLVFRMESSLSSAYLESLHGFNAILQPSRGIGGADGIFQRWNHYESTGCSVHVIDVRSREFSIALHFRGR